MTIGERVKLLRKEINLTLEKFGVKLGVTKTALSLIENGKNNLTEQMLLSICREFNVNENWLRTGEGEMFNETPNTLIEQVAKEYNLSEFQKKLVEKYLNLSDQQKQAVQDFLDSIYDDSPQKGIKSKYEGASLEELERKRADAQKLQDEIDAAIEKKRAARSLAEDTANMAGA